MFCKKHRNERPRVAVIGSKGLPSRVSGLEVYVEEISAGLAKDFDITVYCRKRYCDEVLKEYRGIRIVHVPSINTKHLDAISYSFFATFEALFGRYDLFWYHALGPTVTAFLPKLAGKRILSTVHGLDWKREKFGKLSSFVLKMGEASIAKFADEIIVLNAFDQKHFLTKWNRQSNLIKNGVIIHERVGLNELAERFGLGSGEYILYASRIVPEKNLHVLLDAFKRVDTKKKLVIAGSGVHTDDYVKKVHELAKNDERVVFVGHVGSDSMQELYSNAFCYVLPSTIEGQSIGLLEAMSYGLPCLVSDIPENREVARDSAIYFEVGNAEDLTSKLKWTLENYGEAVHLANMGLSIVCDEHSIERTVANTKAIIERCLIKDEGVKLVNQDQFGVTESLSLHTADAKEAVR